MRACECFIPMGGWHMHAHTYMHAGIHARTEQIQARAEQRTGEHGLGQRTLSPFAEESTRAPPPKPRPAPPPPPWQRWRGRWKTPPPLRCGPACTQHAHTAVGADTAGGVKCGMRGEDPGQATVLQQQQQQVRYRSSSKCATTAAAAAAAATAATCFLYGTWAGADQDPHPVAARSLHTCEPPGLPLSQLQGGMLSLGRQAGRSAGTGAGGAC